MRIDIATLFPEMCERVFNESIVGRGIKNGFIEVYAHNIRSYTEDKHRNVDDKPFGGGTGMVMQAQPIYDCVKEISAQHKSPPRVIYLSPQGETLTQNKVRELAEESGLILICGHYEGVDERVIEELNAEEISVGDYVLTGGELPALILTDAVARLQPGVLPNEDAYSIESHYDGLLEYPQYSRPEVWKERKVPEVLLSGNHAQVMQWREKMSLEVTKKKRPDMYRAHIKTLTEKFISDFKASAEISENVDFSTLALSDELLKLIKRGKARSIEIAKSSRLEKGAYVILTDILGIPKFVVTITKRLEDSVQFRLIYKPKKEESND
ncbi:MAG: tRNA (guanosine(37)-N1)-methyltransferase TrmD [Oscillospiraceae bacterium]|nr:tRNA (guanosine(37)-N1)-methyltransferase TrmD [Oscillospiraceae bacterium]